jgi:surface polysaccharide O-acyltransferase-like enzyme
LWFITLYAIAGYIKLYGLNEKLTTKHYFVFWLICSVITYSSSVVIMLLAGKSESFPLYVTYFFEQEKITTLLTAVSLFMIFATLKLNYRKWINVIASATFGVYLIHDSNLLRPLIWLKLFKNAQYQDSALLIPYSIGAVIAVYVTCSLIDLLRLYIIEKPFMMLLKRCSQKKIKPFEKFIRMLKNFIFGKQDSESTQK